MAPPFKKGKSLSDAVKKNEALILAHRPLVYKEVERLLSRFTPGIPFKEDLIQEGMIGLFYAAGSYNPKRGRTFGAYSRDWIKARILSYCRKLQAVQPSSHKLRWAESVKNYTESMAGFSDNSDPNPETGEGSKPLPAEMISVSDPSNAIDATAMMGEVRKELHDLHLARYMQRPRRPVEEIQRTAARDIDVFMDRHFKGVLLATLGERYDVSRERARQIYLRVLRVFNSWVKMKREKIEAEGT